MASVPDDRSFDASELAALFRPLETARGLVLAVSGGSDSTALLLLIARWRQAVSFANPILVVTIDHGLRAEAADEARAVAATASGLGFPHRTLVWDDEKPHSNLQDAAREARYRLLGRAARDFGADTIVTAHTEDDQAETFLLALQRGSGVYGLGGMRPLRPLGDLTIARPLLGVSRARLRAMLVCEGVGWVDDPSNENAHFARVRLRHNRAALAALELTNSGLARTAARLARAAEALEIAVDRLIARSTQVFLGGLLRVDPVLLLEAPEEIRLRAFARFLGALSGAPHVPRFERLERLLVAVEASVVAAEPLQRTLSGVTVRFDRDALFFFREAGRERFPCLPVDPGGSVDWDRRVRVSLSQAAPPLQLRALGPGARSMIAARDIPVAALQTLPALVNNAGDIIGVIGLQPADREGAFDFGTAASLVLPRLKRHGWRVDPTADAPRPDEEPEP